MWEITFFPPELLLHNYTCGGYVPCCVVVNTNTIVNWKNFAKCYWRLWHITKMFFLFLSFLSNCKSNIPLKKFECYICCWARYAILSDRFSEAPIAQWLEHWSRKPGVVSSTLTGGIFPLFLHKVALLRCFSFHTQMSFIFNYNKWAINK